MGEFIIGVILDIVKLILGERLALSKSTSCQRLYKLYTELDMTIKAIEETLAWIDHKRGFRPQPSHTNSKNPVEESLLNVYEHTKQFLSIGQELTPIVQMYARQTTLEEELGLSSPIDPPIPTAIDRSVFHELYTCIKYIQNDIINNGRLLRINSEPLYADVTSMDRKQIIADGKRLMEYSIKDEPGLSAIVEGAKEELTELISIRQNLADFIRKNCSLDDLLA